MKTARIKVANLLLTGFGLICLFLAAVMADDRWPKIELATDVRLRVTDIAALDRRVITPNGRAALEKVVAAYKDYTQGQNKLIALVQAGRDEEARSYLNQQVKPMLAACRETLAAQIT